MFISWFESVLFILLKMLGLVIADKLIAKFNIISDEEVERRNRLILKPKL